MHIYAKWSSRADNNPAIRQTENRIMNCGKKVPIKHLLSNWSAIHFFRSFTLKLKSKKQQKKDGELKQSRNKIPLACANSIIWAISSFLQQKTKKNETIRLAHYSHSFVAMPRKDNPSYKPFSNYSFDINWLLLLWLLILWKKKKNSNSNYTHSAMSALLLLLLLSICCVR